MTLIPPFAGLAADWALLDHALAIISYPEHREMLEQERLAMLAARALGAGHDQLRELSSAARLSYSRTRRSRNTRARRPGTEDPTRPRRQRWRTPPRTSPRQASPRLPRSLVPSTWSMRRRR